MRTTTTASMLVMCLAALAPRAQGQQSAAPVMFRGDASHSGTFETDGVEELGGERWRFQTGAPVRSSPVVADGRLYVGSTDGQLYALDASTGRELWRVETGSAVSSSAAVAGGLVVFLSADGTCRAVDAETGEERWRVATGDLLPWPWGDEGWDVYLSSAVVQGNTVVFGSGDGAIYAVDLRSGRERWHVDTGGRIRSTPAIANGSVYVGSTDGVVYRLSLDDGSLEWRHETEGVTFDSGEFGFDRKSIIASPAVLDGIVYVGSRDGFMYMLDEATGDRLRRVSHEVSWAMSSPAVRDGAMFAGTSDGLFVHRVDVDTGEEVWRYVGAGYTWSSPALVGNTVYIGDGGGYLTAIDADTGAERWSFATGEGVYASPWVEDGVVYFGADDGAVYAVDGETPPVHRAVFWDEDLTSTYTALDHVAARVFFQLRGYQVLDAESLASFIEDRIDDGASSTVVFALPVIPPTVAAEPADTVLFRRYLEAGGKAVWLGLPPMSVVTDDSGQITGIDRERSGLLLGMDYSESNFDFYGSLPTALGRQWGLSSGWLSQYAHDVSDDIQVLGLDEHGRASAWVKNFGGPVGTGFVGFGLPEVTLEALEAARVLAEYGLGGTGR